ncbi:MAG: hypothetical protein SFW09_10095 [Hyphomicrobiaceae bacterium]|nr:hypothetical protein [Hyphomicrobiaceae bacterium]
MIPSPISSTPPPTPPGLAVLSGLLASVLLVAGFVLLSAAERAKG